jgi:hypothetical protein
LEAALSQELFGDPAHGYLVSGYYRRWGLHEQPVPRPVVVARLVVHGWTPRRAGRWFFERDHAMHHETTDLRRAHSRAYRRRSNALVISERYDELAPYRGTGGWLTW